MSVGVWPKIIKRKPPLAWKGPHYQMHLYALSFKGLMSIQFGCVQQQLIWGSQTIGVQTGDERNPQLICSFILSHLDSRCRSMCFLISCYNITLCFGCAAIQNIDHCRKKKEKQDGKSNHCLPVHKSPRSSRAAMLKAYLDKTVVICQRGQLSCSHLFVEGGWHTLDKLSKALVTVAMNR